MKKKIVELELALKCNNKKIEKIAEVDESANNDTTYASVIDYNNNEDDNGMRNETDGHNIIKNCNTDKTIENLVSDIGKFRNEIEKILKEVKNMIDRKNNKGI